jgi:indoleamine 2,3-dioxygenase
MTKMTRFTEYEISRNLGFLSQFDAAHASLPTELEEVVSLAMRLPQLILTGEVRKHIDGLAVIDLQEFCRQAHPNAIRMAMVHYAFMAQSYIWGQADAIHFLPACLAMPIHQLSQATGQPPILTYSNYVLDNWRKIDSDGEVNLSNIELIQPFLGGQDEAWFVLIHVAIEATAGQVLAEFPSVIRAAAEHDAATLERGLLNIVDGWSEINAIFDRMPERCDPYVYFHRVRPWIHGFKDNPALPNGVVYKGVEEFSERGQFFRGQTGSQSSIVPSMDALLKVNHAADPLRAYLDELHIYRPPAHRRFIEDVHASGNLREAVVASSQGAVKEAYNECLEKLAAFRTKHLEYAASYINKQGKGGAGNSTEVGTGGTPFMKYLKKHRDEVNRQKV